MIGTRVEERMKATGLSQSELARRVGMSQQAVHKLIKGSSRSTANLHRFARELGTSPSYLAGETDDPEANAAPLPALSHDDRQLLARFGSLPSGARAALLTVAGAMTNQSGADYEVDGLPDEDLLTEIFDALLAGIADSEPRIEKARLLARRLPIGLAQARDAQPAPPVVDHSAPAPSPPEVPATRRSAPVP